MSSNYAKDTEVSADRSRAEIEKLILAHDGKKFAYGWDADQNVAALSFELNGRRVRFTLPLPSKDDHSFRYTPGTRQRRDERTAIRHYEQAVRARWRSLLLVIKAKLVAVDDGIVAFEDEFLAYIVLPNDSTVGDWARDQIADAYRTQEMPPMLPGASPSRLSLPDFQRSEP